jgi:cobalt-zinc-cadmium efflux system protein
MVAHMGGHGHSHARGHGHGHGHGTGMSDRRRLGWALAITLGVLVVEVVGAALTGSLALLADAGHLATDALGLMAALLAAVLAQRPPCDLRTFGLGRAEILAAALNALVLLAVAGVVGVEAVGRLADPPAVPGAPLLLLGALGLIGNLVALAVLMRGSGSGAEGATERSLNLRGAMLEVLGDALGSVAVIAAAVVVLTTGWRQADPVASLAIAALILPRALGLLREAAHVLLEGTPRGLDAAEVGRALRDVPGVLDVHDLHLWTITSGRHAVSAHLVVAKAVAVHCGETSVLDAAAARLSTRFGLTHSTLQVEQDGHAGHEHIC